MPADRAYALTTASASVDGGATLLTAGGVLDANTYLPLRDEIVKTALEEPTAVLVDVSDLDVPAQSALAVFTSARWHVVRWPEVPIMLVCRQQADRAVLERNGIARLVPVHSSVDAAIAALSTYSPRRRRRARANLPAEMSSLIRARGLVDEWLTAWSKPDLVAVSKIVVTTFVENVLQHTDTAPTVRLEAKSDTVTVAVEDGSRTPPTLSEEQLAADLPTGLRIVDLLCRVWGNAPTPSGKTVWAVIGPENRL
ncbi:sulfate transporter [Mycobacteriaceae bacterium 1482268.1]|nr:sulfate transporter [Mycobacteriaceae bacterium 1482268.1]